MKCPKCGEELSKTPMSMLIDTKQQKKNYSFHCRKKYSDRELQDIKDAELIDEDMKIWRGDK